MSRSWESDVLGGRGMAEYNEREERRKFRVAAEKLHKLVPAYKVWVEDIDDEIISKLNETTKGKIVITRLGKYIVQWFYTNPKAITPQKRQNTFYILPTGIYENPEDNEKIKVVDEEGAEKIIDVSESSRRSSARIVARMLASLHLLDKYRRFR